MKEKDITQKVLEDNNDIFADIVNVLLFDGKSEVEENELVNTTVHLQYKAEDGKVHEQERDIAKYWKRGCTDIVLYGIENQTKVEKRMPMEAVSNKYDVLELKQLITEHVAYTNSKKGKEILDNFGEYLPKFKKIMPHDYKKMLNMIVQMEEKGLSSEQAQIEAFYAATK